MKYFLGIDVSKGYADFILVSDHLEVIEKAFQIDDTRTGHDQLKVWLKLLFVNHPGLELDCGVESTGGYENNWYALLFQMSTVCALRVSRLNPASVKLAANATLRANKTDAESAFDIAAYLKRYADQVEFDVQQSSYTAFRSFHNHIELQIKQRTQLINELKQLLYSSFPELQRFCKQGVPNWVLKLIQQYPSPHKLVKAKAVKVAKIKGISQKKAEQLIEKATQTVACRTAVTDEYLLKMIASEIQDKTERIKLSKAHLEQHCKGPEMDLLISIKGIGTFSAAVLMIHIEDIRRFGSPKALASYFGLHPVIKESGDKKAVSRMSKKGRPAVRALLYMCANSAVLADSHMRSIYASHRAKGKNHDQALGVIMHKLLRIVWGVLTNKTEYLAEIDQQNTRKHIQSAETTEQNKIAGKRRIQAHDENAPISRIEQKKRKAYATSQAGHAGRVRDLVHRPVENI